MEVYAAALLIAVVCAIVIYNIFYISVMGKMREYGRLKVLGTTPKQLKRVVKRERRFLTAVVGSAAGNRGWRGWPQWRTPSLPSPWVSGWQSGWCHRSVGKPPPRIGYCSPRTSNREPQSVLRGNGHPGGPDLLQFQLLRHGGPLPWKRDGGLADRILFPQDQ